MERAQSRRRQSRSGERIQMRRNTEVQQETNNTERDEFDLLFHQRKMRCELRDSEVRLTQVGSEGRVLLEIQEEALSYILDQLREKTEMSSEKEPMEKEICGLKAQLDKSNVHRSKTETEELKSQIHVLCKKLSLTVDELEV